MKLSAQQKTTLLLAAKRVYSSYLALDFFKNTEFVIREPEGVASGKDLRFTILSYVKKYRNNLGDSAQNSVSVWVGNKEYSLCLQTISTNPHQFSAILQYPFSEAGYLSKVPMDYSEEEMADAIVNKPFILEVNSEGDVSASLAINEQYTIGGPEKRDLWRSHLVTLFNFIQKIEVEEDITSLLVALATGSGKTYVQGLWLCILSLAEFNGVFAMPDELIQQSVDAIKQILPDTLTQKIVVLRKQSSPDLIAEKIQSLQQKGVLLIAPSTIILDRHYEQLMGAAAELTCFNFDEQHLLMAQERSRKRLLRLSHQFLSVFLTATPAPETYDISGGKPVAIMSSGQKQKAGQGQFPKIHTVHCEFTDDLRRYQRQRAQFTLTGALYNLAETLILLFDRAIQPEYSSSIRAILQKLPYIVNHNEQEQDLRWRLQVPMASKMLCILDDNESLVNGCHYLQSTDNDNLYHNGNFIPNGSVAEAFGMPDVSAAIAAREHSYQMNVYLEQLSEEERMILRPILNSNLSDRLRSNIFHYMVEYVLSDLSGQNLIEHNRLRRRSAQEFQQLIKQKYQRKDRDYFFNKLQPLLDANGARAISGLLAGISAEIGVRIQQNDTKTVSAFADNWFLDDQLLRSMNQNFVSDFENYTDEHLILGVMSGMEESETPIQDSRPFFGLHEERYSLYTNSGTQAARAKRRQRTSIELLNDQMQESSFEPKYRTGLTEDKADNYFRLGFVGMYLSNKKTAGFNDPNQHTILNAAEQTYAKNNSPVDLIQGIGRARGLDNTVLPHYIHGLGRQETSSFDLNLLNEDDYYPELFIAQRKFHQANIAALGEQIGQDIIVWYHQHQEEDDSIDPDLLKRQVLHLVAKALRKLNIQETHQIRISRALLPKVIAYAMAKIDKEIAHNQQPYQLSLFVRIVGSFINFFCECYFTILQFKPWLAMVWHQWTMQPLPLRQTLSEAARHAEEDRAALKTKQADAVYLKILRQAHFKDLVAQGLIAAEFTAWFRRKTNAMQIIVKKSILDYLKPEIRAHVTVHLEATIFPLFKKMVVVEKAAFLEEKLKNFSGLLSFLEVHQEQLQALQESLDDAQFSERALVLLRKIPGLESLSTSDIVNYPAQAHADMQWFEQLSIATLGSEPELKEQVADMLTAFLRQELPQYLDAFLIYPDQLLLSSQLQHRPLEQIRTCVNTYLERCIANPEWVDDVSILFGELQRSFSLEVELLPKRIEQVKEALETYQITCIADLVQKELLPCMINLYPLAARERLLQEMTQDKLVTLLRTERSTISELSNKPTELAKFLTDSLCTNVPAQIDLEAEKAHASNFFSTQTKGWAGVRNAARYYTDRVGKSFGVDFGLIPGKVKKLIQSENFLESIALLLPFHHWKELKAKLQSDTPEVQDLAQSLAVYVDAKDSLTPSLLLTEINQALHTTYQSTPDYAEQIGQRVERFASGMETEYPTADLQQTFTNMIRNQCLPLLATFLGSKELKADFLKYPYEPKQLSEFYVKNFALLQDFSNQDPTQQRAMVTVWFQQLRPNFVTEDSIIDPVTYAERQGAICKTGLIHRLRTVFGMSTAFKRKLGSFFNATDTQSLENCLARQDVSETIMRALPADHASLDESLLLAAVRAGDPSLQNIESLPKRLNQFAIAMQGLQEQGHIVLDNHKLADLVTEQIQPALKHARFIAMLQLHLGSLQLEELTLIFSARRCNEPEKIAAQLLRFKDLILRQDFTTFKQEFMQCPADIPYSFEHCPAHCVLNHFAILVEEVMSCHLYYRQHDAKGEQIPNARPPAFLTDASDAVKAMRIPIFNTFLSSFSRKIFFVQGVRNGLPIASQVFADSHQELIHNLYQIKNHLLRPLWWSVNTFSWVYYVLVKLKTIIYVLWDLGFEVMRRLNEGLNQIFGGPPSRPELKKLDPAFDFTLSAYETAKVINELTPLTTEQVAQPDCPGDVIETVEHNINALPHYRVRLFGQVREATETFIPVANQQGIALAPA